MIVAPPAGAGPLSVIVPLTDRLTPMVPAEEATVIVGRPTVTVAIPGRKTGADALTSVLPRLDGVTVKLMPMPFAGTVTVGGTVTTPGSCAVSETVCPPG